MNVHEVFEKWWHEEAMMDGSVSLKTAFIHGWSIGFKKSANDDQIKEKLIFDAIRPLVHNLDDIIVNTLVKRN